MKQGKYGMGQRVVPSEAGKANWPETAGLSGTIAATASASGTGIGASRYAVAWVGGRVLWHTGDEIEAGASNASKAWGGNRV
jgi:hypothetical protein